MRDLGALEECDMVILSDANTVFIAEILRHHSLLTCFRQARTAACPSPNRLPLRPLPNVLRRLMECVTHL